MLLIEITYLIIIIIPRKMSINQQFFIYVDDNSTYFSIFVVSRMCISQMLSRSFFFIYTKGF